MLCIACFSKVVAISSPKYIFNSKVKSSYTDSITNNILITKEYYKDGEKFREIILDTLSNEGLCVEFYIDGRQKAIGRVIKNQNSKIEKDTLINEWTYGITAYKEKYIKDGTWTLYTENGRISQVQEYSYGSRVGKWFIYDYKKEIIQIINYENNKKIRQTEVRIN